MLIHSPRLRADDVTDPSVIGLILMGSWLEAQLVPGKWVDDRWPILQKIPKSLAPWRSAHDENAVILNKIARAWWDPAKVTIEQGGPAKCFVTDFLDKYESEGFNEDEAALVALGLMLAGAGTSAATHNFLLMGCALYPDTVRKAQEELDRVIGDSRLPTIDDEDSLPYVRAMIKETLRWRPFSNQGESDLCSALVQCLSDHSVGFYHATVKDDYYNGYFIPAGTTIINNAYSVHQDETRFPDPDRFEPMRFINHNLSALNYANLTDADKRDHFAYGVGRRICAGLSVAEPSLFLLAARTLWGFNIAQSRDGNGNLVPINTMAYAGKSTPPNSREG